MPSLFADDPQPLADTPLAERMRPRTLDDVQGQAELLGPGRPLRGRPSGPVQGPFCCGACSTLFQALDMLSSFRLPRSVAATMASG